MPLPYDNRSLRGGLSPTWQSPMATQQCSISFVGVDVLGDPMPSPGEKLLSPTIPPRLRNVPPTTTMSFRGSKATVGISWYDLSTNDAETSILPGDCHGHKCPRNDMKFCEFHVGGRTMKSPYK